MFGISLRREPRTALLSAALFGLTIVAAGAGPNPRGPGRVVRQTLSRPRAARVQPPRAQTLRTQAFRAPARLPVHTLPLRSVSAPSVSDPAAQDLLRRMLLALNTLSLEGDQVTSVTRPSGPDTSAELHILRNGTRALRLEYRQPSRFVGIVNVDNGRLEWDYTPASNTLKISPSKVQRQHVNIPQVLAQVRRGVLIVQMIGQDTVAGHACAVIQVTPRTPVSSYRYWVDPTNGAQLKIEEYGASGQRISTSYYTDITYNPVFAPRAFALPRTPKDVHLVIPNIGPVLPSIPAAQAQAGFVVAQPVYMPAGFHFQSASVTDFQRKRMVNLRYANGLNVLNLFETPINNPNQSRIGSPRPGVFTIRQAGLDLVLVGSLSADEMQKVLSSVH